ncbi:MAG: hypothetical protein JOZ46_03805 [Candidatus Dormibacteraeota bacterium]|nr:hypothetical protein [Candidatus Dormibacteraeota bacterium]MBV9524926.1 hypothetical protein [Candidatus Dormibacteraeota bacterium]
MRLNSVYLGIAWRAAAWSVALGTATGAAYAAVYGLFLIPLQVTFIFTFAGVGAELGAIAGGIAAVVNTASLTVLTAMRPPERFGRERYIAAVRRTASLGMLACGLLTFAVYGIVTLSLAGFILFLIPSAIAASLAHRFAPHAVLWHLRGERRYASATVSSMPDDTAQHGDRDAAPDSTREGIDEQVQADEAGDTVTRREESGVGPGAGNAPVVKVTAPVQREDDDVTKHPTLRDDDEREG